jgi:dolichol-phosphate mannosyltransferase
VRAKQVEIVLPVFNELPNIAPLILALDAATAKLAGRVEFKYLFVNDGSTDGTRMLLDQLCVERRDIRVVHLIHNFGHSAAIRCGLAHASGDAVIVMDADLQDSPDALPRLIEAWENGATTVVAERGEREERNRWMFKSFHFLMSRLSPAHPSFGTFSLLDRTVVDRLLMLRENNAYFPSLVMFASESVTVVRVDRRARLHGQSRVGAFGLMKLAITAFLNASSMPVHLASLVGVISSLGAFIALLVIFSLKILTDLPIPGWASIMSAVFLGSGLQLLCLGIIGEYISRIYEEIKSRPSYFVQSTEQTRYHQEAA